MAGEWIPKPGLLVECLLVGLLLLFIYGDWLVWQHGNHRMALIFPVIIAVAVPWMAHRNRRSKQE